MELKLLYVIHVRDRERQKETVNERERQREKEDFPKEMKDMRDDFNLVVITCTLT